MSTSKLNNLRSVRATTPVFLPGLALPRKHDHGQAGHNYFTHIAEDACSTSIKLRAPELNIQETHL